MKATRSKGRFIYQYIYIQGCASKIDARSRGYLCKHSTASVRVNMVHSKRQSILVGSDLLIGSPSSQINLISIVKKA
jgi:hypothetical protein